MKMKIEIEIDDKILTFLEKMGYTYSEIELNTSDKGFSFYTFSFYSRGGGAGINAANTVYLDVSNTGKYIHWHIFAKEYSRFLRSTEEDYDENEDKDFLGDVFSPQQLEILCNYSIISLVTKPEYKVNIYY